MVPLEHCIETESLVLRRSRDEEIGFVWEATQIAGFCEGMPWDIPGDQQTLREIIGDVDARWRNCEAYCFTIWDRQALEKRGRISLELQGKRWLAGFWVHPRFQGAGIASEALGGLLVFAFETLSLKEVEAAHFDWNEASRRVLRKLGFRFRNRLANAVWKLGEWQSVERLSLSAEQWRQSRLSGEAELG